MSRNYKFHNKEGIYFVSFATVYWIDVFIRRVYFDYIVENLNNCIEKKGMIVFAWCIMPSHLHLMFKSTTQAPQDLLRDFKSFTSKGMVKHIEENPQESRKEWMLNSFKKAALNNSNNANNQFWQQHNQPIEVWSNEIIDQKKNYIHQNPVEAGFVENDYEYLYSSARDYAEIKGLVNIEKI
jgi:putative transposase